MQSSTRTPCIFEDHLFSVERNASLSGFFVAAFFQYVCCRGGAEPEPKADPRGVVLHPFWFVIHFTDTVYTRNTFFNTVFASKDKLYVNDPC